MIEVGQKVRATRHNGTTVEGAVSRVTPLYEGCVEATGLLGALVMYPKKQIGNRYYIKCATCGGETPVDVCTTLEVIDEAP